MIQLLGGVHNAQVNLSTMDQHFNKPNNKKDDTSRTNPTERAFGDVAKSHILEKVTKLVQEH